MNGFLAQITSRILSRKLLIKKKDIKFKIKEFFSERKPKKIQLSFKTLIALKQIFLCKNAFTFWSFFLIFFKIKKPKKCHFLEH